MRSRSGSRHLAVGDFDSVSPEPVEAAEAAGVRVERHPAKGRDRPRARARRRGDDQPEPHPRPGVGRWPARPPAVGGAPPRLGSVRRRQVDASSARRASTWCAVSAISRELPASSSRCSPSTARPRRPNGRPRYPLRARRSSRDRAAASPMSSRTRRPRRGRTRRPAGDPAWRAPSDTVSQGVLWRSRWESRLLSRVRRRGR